VCYIIKSLKGAVSLFTLRNVYFAKFQPLVSYGLIFWGGGSKSGKVLKIQKKDTSFKGRYKEQNIMQTYFLKN
jgi:hypothetical protein